MSEFRNCPLCGHENAYVQNSNGDTVFVECPVCGRAKYDISSIETFKMQKNEIPIFLFYNKKQYSDERAYFLIDSNYKEEIEKYAWTHNTTASEIKSFCDCSFAEKIDKILINIANRSPFIGGESVYLMEEYISLLFAERYDNNHVRKKQDLIESQLIFMEKYLVNQGYIEPVYWYEGDTEVNIKLLHEGWKRVDELQKNNPNNKNVFIAMSFAEEMRPVRDAIKKAIGECGYLPRIMNEIEHNHQIVPEMLYEIRQAKFVIAELTGHNNGAYFEAGYALGQGKDVIQLCKEDTFGTDGHFDVKQVNTVLWKDEEDLTKKLINRIKATIE